MAATGVFDDDTRFTVVVTQFDKTFGDDTEQTQESIYKVICRDLENILKKKVPQTAVVSVCGKWAFVARGLKKYPEDQNFKRQVKSALCICPDAPGGETLGPRQLELKNIPMEPADALADRLLHVTGIEILEERIRTMAAACARTWVNSYRERYLGYLQTASPQIADKIQKLRADKKYAEVSQGRVLKKHSEMEDEIAKLKQAMSPQSVVYKQVLEGCKKDVTEASTGISRKLQDIKDECEEKITQKAANFGPTELRIFITKRLDELRQNLFDDICTATCFHHGMQEWTLVLKQMKIDIRQVQKMANSILGLEDENLHPPNTDTTNGSRNAAQENPDIDDVFSGRKLIVEDFMATVTIPPLQESFWEHITKGFWTLMHLVSGGRIATAISIYRSPRDIADTMEKVVCFVEGPVEKYLQDIDTSVAEVFFTDYHNNTESQLQAFEEKYREPLEQKILNDSECLKDLTIQIEKFEMGEERIRELQQELKVASEQYKDVLDHRYNNGAATLQPQPGTATPV